MEGYYGNKGINDRNFDAKICKQGDADIYVIPFSGESDIDYEEMVQTFQEMDQGYHGSEYLDYLAEQEE